MTSSRKFDLPAIIIVDYAYSSCKPCCCQWHHGNVYVMFWTFLLLSPTFLPRDAMLARYMLWPCVRVCLSRVGVLLKRLNIESRKQNNAILLWYCVIFSYSVIRIRAALLVAAHIDTHLFSHDWRVRRAKFNWQLPAVDYELLNWV